MKYIYLKTFQNSTKCPESKVPLMRNQIIDYTRCFNREGEYKGLHYDPVKDSFVLDMLFKINYFEENSKLYYVNALNDDKGNLYFEFWGENDNTNYIIGKSSESGESILFNEKNIFSTTPIVASNYHESIIINYNNNINIFYLDNKNINLINLNTEEIFSNSLSNIINNYKIEGDFSYRNSIIKLGNNHYLLSIFIGGYINLITFYFNTENIDGFKIINNYNKEASYSNSTECFQTDSLIIECLITHKLEPNQFSINIYSQNLTELNTNIKFGFYNNSTFTKIFHLKEEIGIYIFFDLEDGNKPKIFFKKLINYNLFDLFDFNSDTSKNNAHQFIKLDANGKINNINDCLFCSDATKINDSKFVIILTTKKSKELIICLFDLYNDDSSLRLRYYKSDLDLMNIKISFNLRSFVFKNYFGLVFYDSYNEYPGYLFFGYPNLVSKDKINITSIKIKLFIDSSEPYSYSLSDNFEIVNNIYGGEEKIKILNFSAPDKTGIIIKSSKLNSEIFLNQLLDNDDKLIFEQSSEGIIPGNYILEFIPITKLSKDNNIYETFYYGNAKGIDFDEIEYFSNETYKLIYTIECYEKCETCNQLGNESFYHCVKCLNDKFIVVNNGEKCVCSGYNYINEEDQNSCKENCTYQYYKYFLSENEKYCLSSCEYDGKILQKDELNKICYVNCSEDINGNKNSYKKMCVKNCPENYIPDENGICYYNKCENYLYFDKNIYEYQCTENKMCPKNYPFLKKELKMCFENCKLEELEKNQCNYNFINISNEINMYNYDDFLKNIRMEMKNNMNKKRLDNGETIIIENGPITYTISSIEEQNLKSLSNNMSIIDFNKCKQKLIDKNIIQEEQNLYIMKLDIQEEGMPTPIIEYEIYYYPENEDNLTLLDLSACENIRINIILPITINKNEIEKYNISSDYYNDICKSYTTEEGTDLSLKDRQKEYLEKNLIICQEGCYFSEYYFNLEKAVCSCLTKIKLENISDIRLNNPIKNTNFRKIKYKANFDLMKCAFSIFKRKEYRNNSANYIMMIIFLKSIETLILLIIRGYTKINKYINEIYDIKQGKEKKVMTKENLQNRIIKNKNNKNMENNNLEAKKISIYNNSKGEENNSHHELKKSNISVQNEKNEINDIEMKNINHSVNNNNDLIEDKNKIAVIYKERKIIEDDNLIYNDSELNILNYENAKKYDKRTYLQYYLSLIKMRHILISIFFERNDYNLDMIKTYLLLFAFGINYSICILFYNYNTMHKIYEEKGKFNFAYQFPDIISSSCITLLLINLISKICLCEDNIITIKRAEKENLKDLKKKEIKVIYWKFVAFFIVTYIILFFFWVYSISFCIVYKNTQTHLLIQAIISFIFTCIIPFIIYLIPGIFRILSLQKDNVQGSCLYIFSKILQVILC